MLRNCLVLGCIFLSTAGFALEDPTPALPAQHLAVPLTPQATSYSCGAAVALSVLTYWKVWDGNEVDLYRTLGTTQNDGTHPKSLAAGLKKFGLDAALKTGMSLDDLRAALKVGATVILDIQAWKLPGNRTPWEENWDDGHYVVLVAMDATYAYVMDPSTKAAYAYVPLTELVARWHDYEDRTGKREEYVHAGIIVRGRDGMRQFPDSLVRMY